MLLSLVTLLSGCSQTIIANKEELAKAWKQICVDKKSDKFSDDTAKQILDNNISREEWLGKEKCQKTSTQ